LRFAGVRASPRRVRRVMCENGLLAPHRVGRTEAKPHDGTIVTAQVRLHCFPETTVQNFLDSGI
jgi:hypothetical protein